MMWIGRVILFLYRTGYEHIVKRLLFRFPAHDAHIWVVKLLRWVDRSTVFCSLLGCVRQLTIKPTRVSIGDVRLESPFMLAAGFVKGDGFSSEEEALAAIEAGCNIIPGWRAVPQLVGAVEFGSFTRYPRLGDLGVVVWRDEATQSTQNRVGLKNPGAMAAAIFLAKHRKHLPKQFGINIAVSPGVTEIQQACQEILESVEAFLKLGVIPAWLTLNLSCPNTEDDPNGRQTEALARELCGSTVQYIKSQNQRIPVWVKVSPGLSIGQYALLMRVLNDVGISAVIASNTLAKESPGDSSLVAGVGGGKLHQAAVEAVRTLVLEKDRQGYGVDVIGCGGVLDGRTYQDFYISGVQVVQYWSALIFRGPLAAAVIQQEFNNEARNTTADRQGVS